MFMGGSFNGAVVHFYPPSIVVDCPDGKKVEWGEKELPFTVYSIRPLPFSSPFMATLTGETSTCLMNLETGEVIRPAPHKELEVIGELLVWTDFTDDTYIEINGEVRPLGFKTQNMKVQGGVILAETENGNLVIFPNGEYIQGNHAKLIHGVGVVIDHSTIHAFNGEVIPLESDGETLEEWSGKKLSLSREGSDSAKPPFMTIDSVKIARDKLRIEAYDDGGMEYIYYVSNLDEIHDVEKRWQGLKKVGEHHQVGCVAINNGVITVGRKKIGKAINFSYEQGVLRCFDEKRSFCVDPETGKKLPILENSELRVTSRFLVSFEPGSSTMVVDRETGKARVFKVHELPRVWGDRVFIDDKELKVIKENKTIGLENG